ncbi:hypothetical protein [Candidatus Poriferisodalis sp.]|uniref:hypothetical protein n=1 Tax=Candidatus Poriferisodalis sp. TaxID=3101277 RepID=UPI003B01DE3A
MTQINAPIDELERAWAVAAPNDASNIYPQVQRAVVTGGRHKLKFPCLLYTSQGIQPFGEAAPSGNRPINFETFLVDVIAQDYRQSRTLAEAFRKELKADGWEYLTDNHGLDLVVERATTFRRVAHVQFRM